MSDLDPATLADRDAIYSCEQCMEWMRQPIEFNMATFRLPPPPPPDEAIVARVHRRTVRDGISHDDAVLRMWWAAVRSDGRVMEAIAGVRGALEREIARDLEHR